MVIESFRLLQAVHWDIVAFDISETTCRSTWSNASGGLVIRAEKVGADTLLSRIVTMVAEAQRSRAPIQKLAEVVAGYFVPAVVLVAVSTFVVWSLVGSESMSQAAPNPPSSPGSPQASG